MIALLSGCNSNGETESNMDKEEINSEEKAISIVENAINTHLDAHSHYEVWHTSSTRNDVDQKKQVDGFM